MTESTRQPTPVDAVAEAHFDAVVAASPIDATYLGVPGGETELDDLSPEGYAHHVQIARDTLARLDTVEPVDEVDRVTVAAMRERLGLTVEAHEAGYDRMELNVIATPLQSCRDVFDLMPTATQHDWATIATRLTKVPTALEQWTSTLRESADRGLVTPRRQVTECIAQCADLTTPDGFFATFLARASAGGAPLDDAVRADLQRGVEAAAAAYQRLGEDLRTHLLDRAPESDAAGRERYQLASRQFLGATVDLEETYAWGQEELARIEADMRATADRIVPGASVKEAIEHLDRDPALPAARHRRAARLDAGARRRGHRRPGRHPLRHPGAGAHHRVPDRPHPDRRHLLHRARATTSPARAGCGGRCPRASPSSAPGAS